jgi:hypothetical protein
MCRRGGETVEENLALACVSCSLRKEARQSGVDAETGKRVPLFHPRRDVWATVADLPGVLRIGSRVPPRCGPSTSDG